MVKSTGTGTGSGYPAKRGPKKTGFKVWDTSQSKFKAWGHTYARKAWQVKHNHRLLTEPIESLVTQGIVSLMDTEKLIRQRNQFK